MNLVKEQSAFLLDVCKLIEYATESGLDVTGDELKRTTEQQAIYLKTGKSKTKYSNHLRKLAIDLNFFRGEVWLNGLERNKAKTELQYLGDFWESLHPFNRWGGNFVDFLDIPHFERNAK